MEKKLVDNKDYYIGVDIGGTKIIVALLDARGKFYAKKIIPTKDYMKAEKAIARINSLIAEIFKKNKLKNIKGIGIGAAGVISHQEGIIKFSPNLKWKKVPIVSMIKSHVNVPVYLDNDANAAAWGIFYLNYAKKYNYFLCLTLGTGIGGGLVLDGKIYRGASGSAGEIGHITFMPQGSKCNCGNLGCIESYVGTEGIIKRIHKYLESGEKTIINKLAPLDKITPETLYLAARKNDKLAIKIWEELAEMLGITLAGVINLLNLELIYVTGGLSHAQKWFKAPLISQIKKSAFPSLFKDVKIVFARQKKNLGVIGAGLLAAVERSSDD